MEDIANTKIRVRYDPALGEEYQIYFIFKHQTGEVSTGEPLVMKKREPGDYTRPTMQLNQDSMQQLLDDLWNLGIRPSNMEANPGPTQERHISDLRKIVFKLLKVKE